MSVRSARSASSRSFAALTCPFCGSTSASAKARGSQPLLRASSAIVFSSRTQRNTSPREWPISL